MSIEQKLSEALLLDVGVQTVVGARVYPTIAPAEAGTPFVVTLILSKAPLTLDGEYEQAQAQLHCWGVSYTDAKAVRTAVRSALAAAVQNGLTVSVDVESDLLDQDTELFGVSLGVTLYANAI